jgi:F420-0:gamma-glutamyl ligase
MLIAAYSLGVRGPGLRTSIMLAHKAVRGSFATLPGTLRKSVAFALAVIIGSSQTSADRMP